MILPYLQGKLFNSFPFSGCVSVFTNVDWSTSVGCYKIKSDDAWYLQKAPCYKNTLYRNSLCIVSLYFDLFKNQTDLHGNETTRKSRWWVCCWRMGKDKKIRLQLHQTWTWFGDNLPTDLDWHIQKQEQVKDWQLYFSRFLLKKMFKVFSDSLSNLSCKQWEWMSLPRQYSSWLCQLP